MQIITTLDKNSEAFFKQYISPVELRQEIAILRKKIAKARKEKKTEEIKSNTEALNLLIDLYNVGVGYAYYKRRK